MAIKRATMVVAAIAIQAVIIMSVVLSSIGASPAYRPSPGGASTGPIPMPSTVLADR
jgi:hypothetical protein